MRVLLALMISLILAGCVQPPTKNTEVVDDRPGLAFELASPEAKYYELKIDGVSYGSVEKYIAGKSRLRIIDGTHQVELINDGRVVFSKKVYLGSGSNRILKVGSNE